MQLLLIDMAEAVDQKPVEKVLGSAPTSAEQRFIDELKKDPNFSLVEGLGGKSNKLILKRTAPEIQEQTKQLNLSGKEPTPTDGTVPAQESTKVTKPQTRNMVELVQDGVVNYKK